VGVAIVHPITGAHGLVIPPTMAIHAQADPAGWQAALEQIPCAVAAAAAAAAAVVAAEGSECLASSIIPPAALPRLLTEDEATAAGWFGAVAPVSSTPLADAWAIAAAGHFLSADLVALQWLETTLTTAGVLAKVDALYPLAGSDLTAAVLPLKGPALAVTGFVDGDYTLSSGLTGGAGKHLSMGAWRPSSGLVGSAFGAILSEPPASTQFLIGHNSSDTLYISISFASANPRVMGNWSGGVAATYRAGYGAAMADAVGFLSVSRSSNAMLKIYRNGTEQARNIQSVSAYPTPTNREIYLMARNNVGSAASHLQARAGLIGISNQALTDAEHLTLSNAVTDYLTAIGRA
jgi:hypothetical protein